MVKVGALLIGVTAIVNNCGALVFILGNTFEPSSKSVTVTVADPLALAAGVKVRSPAGEIAGCIKNRALLSLLTLKDNVCVLPDHHHRWR